MIVAAVSRLLSTDISGSGLHLAWFRIFVLAHVALRSFITVGGPDVEGPWHSLLLKITIAVCVFGLLPGQARVLAKVATACVGLLIAVTFPLTANHIFLEFVCLGLVAFLNDETGEEADLSTTSLRYLSAMFFFWTGLQKVLYGRYFDGQFLGHKIAMEDRFASFFRFFMPADEFQRLKGLKTAQIGDGPYSVDAPLFIALSNSVYVLEMALPVLLVIPRTRVPAAVASMVFVAMIEAAALEVVFGVFMLNLLSLFLRPEWTKRFTFASLAFYAYLVLANLFDLPMMEYYI